MKATGKEGGAGEFSQSAADGSGVGVGGWGVGWTQKWQTRFHTRTRDRHHCHSLCCQLVFFCRVTRYHVAAKQLTGSADVSVPCWVHLSVSTRQGAWDEQQQQQ